jgi:hypothetical protein
MNRRGLSLAEVVLSSALISVCLLVFLSVVSGGLRESIRSREQILADEIVLNTVEEVLGSPFGSENLWWGNGKSSNADPKTLSTTQKVEVPVIVEGKPQSTVFYRRVECASQNGGSGAFFGQRSGDYDVVKISLFWDEPTGESGQAQSKSLQYNLTVWRTNGY